MEPNEDLPIYVVMVVMAALAFVFFVMSFAL